MCSSSSVIPCIERNLISHIEPDVSVPNKNILCDFHSAELITLGRGCKAPEDEIACQLVRGTFENHCLLSNAFLFQQACDGYAGQPDASDEQDCTSWRQTCNRRSVICNQHWYCIDESENARCSSSIYSPIKCPDDYRYCFAPHLTCLHISKIGNGETDCLGATDERDFCLLKYPHESTRRFRCANSTECILFEHICDGQAHCPEHDDELPCPWRERLVGTAGCSNGTFACQNDATCRVDGRVRCNQRRVCYSKSIEDWWFCDLISQKSEYLPLSKNGFSQLPPYKHNSPLLFSVSNVVSQSNQPSSGLYSIISCHRGIVVGKHHCFCPPSYYGDRCQYQSSRVSVHLTCDLPQTPIDIDYEFLFFRLRICLIDKRNETVDQEELLVHPVISYYKHLFYLVGTHTGYHSVRIDAFVVTASTVQLYSTSSLPIPFSFLPVNRLTLRLNLTTSQMVNGSRKADVCPLGRFGRRCRFRYNPCSVLLCVNGGTCIPFDPRTTHFSFICLCPATFFGNRCELSSARAYITIPRLVMYEQDMSSPINDVSLIVVYMTDIYNGIRALKIQEYLIYMYSDYFHYQL